LYTLHAKLKTQNPKPRTLNPNPYTLNLELYTLNPYTLNPKFHIPDTTARDP